MSLIFNQLFDFNLTGANANPIDPTKWTTAVGLSPLQKLNNTIRMGVSGFACGALYTGIVWMANQWIENSVHVAVDNASDLEMVLRSDDSENDCYVFYVDPVGGGFADCAFVRYDGGAATEIFDFGSTVPFSPDDVFRFGIFGSTLYAYRNGVLLGTVDDSTHASGKGGLFMGGSPVELQLSSFRGGSITTDGATPPFLGSVTEVGSAPAGDSDPFIGTVVVVGSAPAGVPNPYLGRIRVVVSPPAGRPNPALGHVVVVGSAPVGRPNPYLGNAVES